MPQLAFYDRISGWVAPGGTLLIVGHLHTRRRTATGTGTGTTLPPRRRSPSRTSPPAWPAPAGRSPPPRSTTAR
ncbi:hypothetical protein NKG94_32145 [Micromonospora sp. M12]